MATGANDRDATRLLIVIATNQRRGAEVLADRLREGLGERGWAVEVLALAAVVENGLDVESLSSGRRSRFDPGIALALRKRLRKRAVDVVLANGGATLRYCALAGTPPGTTSVYNAIGEPLYWIHSASSRRINRFLLTRMDQVLTVSGETRRQLLELQPRLTGRIDVARTGVPAEFFEVKRDVRGDRLRVGFIGSLSSEKNPMLALSAVVAIPDIEMRFVGSGPLGETLRMETRRRAVEDRVTFVGSLPDVRPQLAWADVIVQTSLTEGLPGGLMEAAAAGVMSVASDVGGTREVVVDGVSGALFQPNDESALIHALKEAVADRARVAEMGHEAKQRALRDFTMDTALDRYDTLLRGSIR